MPKIVAQCRKHPIPFFQYYICKPTHWLSTRQIPSTNYLKHKKKSSLFSDNWLTVNFCNHSSYKKISYHVLIFHKTILVINYMFSICIISKTFQPPNLLKNFGSRSTFPAATKLFGYKTNTSTNTNKTEVSFKDDTRSRDSLHLKSQRPKINKGFGYLLEVIDKFSNFAWTIP